MPDRHLLDLEPHGPDVWVGVSPPYGWGRIYGGLVVAQALGAATETVHPEHRIHSLHSYFMLGGDVEQPVRYEVDRIRNGRSFSTRRVVARQAGGAILTLSASFQRDEEAVDVQAVSMPDVPGPAEVDPGEWGAFMDYREMPAEPGSGRSLAWRRFDQPMDDTPAAHACALAYLSDGNPMDAILSMHPVQPEPGGWHDTFVSASLDHSIWFHRPVRANEWVLIDMSTQGLVGSRGVAIGSVYQDGALVATVVQEGLLRLRTR
jgi:acyl-CoA thioesterase II